jgi:pimeloyl-ACP methyl ester carboxylesterase
MADVDIALRHLGEATVLGRGLGGYVAFLIAGARPTLVRGAGRSFLTGKASSS